MATTAAQPGGTVVAPGGFGTCDEMFEMMTLKQTGKMQSAMPIVLLGKEYWKRVINWDAFGQAGVINQRDVDELLPHVREPAEQRPVALRDRGARQARGRARERRARGDGGGRALRRHARDDARRDL